MFWQQKIKVFYLNPGKMQWKIVCELKRRLGVSARNSSNPKRNGKKIAEIEKGLWFKQFSLIACNHQLHVSRGAAPASSSCYKFEIKIGSMVDLNHGLSCQTAR